MLLVRDTCCMYLGDIITIHLCHGRLVSICIQQQTGDKLPTVLLTIQGTCWRRQVDKSGYNLYPATCVLLLYVVVAFNSWLLLIVNCFGNNALQPEPWASYYLRRRQSREYGVRRRLCVCVCLQHNSKTNYPKVCKHWYRNDLEVLVSKDQKWGSQSAKNILKVIEWPAWVWFASLSSDCPLHLKPWSHCAVERCSFLHFYFNLISFVYFWFNFLAINNDVMMAASTIVWKYFIMSKAIVSIIVPCIALSVITVIIKNNNKTTVIIIINNNNSNKTAFVTELC